MIIAVNQEQAPTIPHQPNTIQSFSSSQQIQSIHQPQSNLGPQHSNNSGTWTHQEHIKYVVFLYKHRARFICKHRKRKVNLFQEMSIFVGTRTTIQCRTHHQKFENKLGDTISIIKTYQQQFGLQNFKKLVKEVHEKTIKKSQILNSIYTQNPMTRQGDKVNKETQTDYIFFIFYQAPQPQHVNLSHIGFCPIFSS